MDGYSLNDCDSIVWQCKIGVLYKVRADSKKTLKIDSVRKIQIWWNAVYLQILNLKTRYITLVL